jgi:hypothetical protein
MTELTLLPQRSPASRSAPKNLVKTAMGRLDEIERKAAEVSRLYRAVSDNRGALESTDFARLSAACELIASETIGETNAPAARALFALMLAAIPAAKGFDSAVYLDALLNTVLSEPAEEPNQYGGQRHVGGFTPVVIASAVRAIWRSKTFTPSIAEVLETLRAQRRSLQAGASLARSIQAMKRQAAEREAEREEREDRWRREEEEGSL